MMKVFLKNVTFDELTVGHKISLNKTLTQKDIELFAAISGDDNPIQMNLKHTKNDIFNGIFGHEMWLGSLISTLLGTIFPCGRAIILKQYFEFKKSLSIGDNIKMTIIVRDKTNDGKPIVIFDCKGVNQKRETMLIGEITVLAPIKKIQDANAGLPDVENHTYNRLQPVFQSCQRIEAISTAVVYPVKVSVLESVNEAVEKKLIHPVLIGPASEIKAMANKSGINISKWQLVDTDHSEQAAVKACELAAQRKVGAIMKGEISTHELLSAIVSVKALSTKYRISHVSLIDIPSYHKPLIITDAAVNIAPNLAEKADICQNAINLWRIVFGAKREPKVAILSAIELINPAIKTTVDAGILCKMSDRGQIKGGILDGPLAFDDAINKQAADKKGIQSQVAGDPDILLVPDIESGNILTKMLTFMGHVSGAGIVLGARVPIILTGRNDSLDVRLLSCALALKISDASRKGKIK